MKKKAISIIGTRPEIIKMYPLILKLDQLFNHKIIFSGQHFSKNMAYEIFKDLNLRKPDINIKILDKKNLVSELIKKLIPIVKNFNPNYIIYHGDTLTTLAGALIGYHIFPNIKNVHIEAGYRSKSRNSIEEKIRKIVDHHSKINFAIRREEKNNLLNEGINKNIYVVGNTINDTINLWKKKIKKTYPKKKYIYVTIHRSENVDNKLRFLKILNFLNKISNKVKIILCIHPRTEKMLYKFNLKMNNKIKIIQPTNYTNNLNYLINCFFCISDSGGIQEEAVLLGKKCFIPLNKTPHHYYIDKNANELINVNNIDRISHFLIKKKIKIKKFYHQKNVSEKICKILLKNAC